MAEGVILMRKLIPVVLLTLGQGCAELQGVGRTAIEYRRTMNDMQARATMAATCDISLGAWFRELSQIERDYAALVCGGVLPATPPRASGTAR
jgi:hypothetical protein